MSALGGRGPIVVVGAGPAGALMALYLARQGRDVTVYEARPDIRRVEIPAGRSINLALATRGIVPLVEVGVIERVDAITIPMRGRMVHAEDSTKPVLQPYGTRSHEVVHSVSRRDLNAILLDAAEATGRVRIEFESSVRSIDLDAGTLAVVAPNRVERIVSFGTVFGADGAGSDIRKAIVAANEGGAEVSWLDHGYKELSTPPILAMAALRASLDVFDRAGGMEPLRKKSERQIEYLDLLLAEVIGDRVESITPTALAERGCQFALRVRMHGVDGRAVYQGLADADVACDWRYPDVIRVAPVPLYNSFSDIHRFVDILDRVLDEVAT